MKDYKTNGLLDDMVLHGPFLYRVVCCLVECIHYLPLTPAFDDRVFLPLLLFALNSLVPPTHTKKIENKKKS